jgi:hypothetical protein
MFSLGIRKLVVLAIIAAVFLLGNVWIVVNWLTDHGVIEWAGWFRHEFLTGTAVTIIAVLMLLIVRPKTLAAKFVRKCSVCDHTVLGNKNYCSDCGSKL